MKYLIKFLTDSSVYTRLHLQTSVHSGNFVGMHVRTSVICWILSVGSLDSSVLRGGTLIHISTWIHFACARRGGGGGGSEIFNSCFCAFYQPLWHVEEVKRAIIMQAKRLCDTRVGCSLFVLWCGSEVGSWRGDALAAAAAAALA